MSGALCYRLRADPSVKGPHLSKVFATHDQNILEFLFLFVPLAIIIGNYIESIKEKWFKELFVSLLLVIPFLLLML